LELEFGFQCDGGEKEKGVGGMYTVS
jgi:hypothetical protein